MLSELTKSTARDSLTYLFAQIIIGGMGLIALPIFARIFVPAEYGLIALALLVVWIGSIITGNWLIGSTTRFFPYYKRMGKSDIFYSSLLFCMILGLIAFYLLGAPVYFLFRDTLDMKFRSLVPLVALLIPLTMGFEIFLANFRIKRQTRRYATFQLSRTLLALIGGLSLVIWLNFGVAGILWGHIIALFILGSAMFKILFLTDNHIKLNHISLSAARKFAKFGFPMIVAAIGTWILTGADRFIIEYFRGTSEVGLYSMGYNIGNMTIRMIVTSLMLAITPSIINIWESDNRELTGRLLTRFTRLLILITLPATIGISVVAKLIFKVFITPAYYLGCPVVPFVAGAGFVYGLSLLSHSGLWLAERTDLIARNCIAAGVINILLNIIFVPQFGFIAAAITTLISYCLLLVLNIKSSNKYLKWVVSLKSVFNIVIASIIMGIGVYIIIHILSTKLLVSIILSIVGGGVIYFTMLFWLNEFTCEEMLAMKRVLRRP